MKSGDSKAVVLLSGGQDSTTCLFWAKVKFNEVHAVSFDYGQKHRIELDQARKIAKDAKVKSWRVLKIEALRELGDAALTNTSEEVSLQGRYPGLPSTFVPGRNSIFLTLAAALARKLDIAHIVTGVCQTDFSGYPDCRRIFIDAKVVELSTAMDYPFVIYTPLMYKTKAESVVMAKSLPGCWNALKHTRTCYHGQFPPCGTCPACTIRAKGFAEAGFADPAIEDYNKFGQFLDGQPRRMPVTGLESAAASFETIQTAGTQPLDRRRLGDRRGRR